MAKTEKSAGSALRAQLSATPIKKLKKVVEEDNEMVGAQSNEYLNLEDGKTLKIRIFPAHPGEENFYVAFISNDAECTQSSCFCRRKFHYSAERIWILLY